MDRPPTSSSSAPWAKPPLFEEKDLDDATEEICGIGLVQLILAKYEAAFGANKLSKEQFRELFLFVCNDRLGTPAIENLEALLQIIYDAQVSVKYHLPVNCSL